MLLRKLHILMFIIFFWGASFAHAFKEEPLPQGQADFSKQQERSDEKSIFELEAVDIGDNAKKGIEIHIPGIGKLGELPKIDFGLELLYGEDRPAVNDIQDEPEDVTIRGSVKHRF